MSVSGGLFDGVRHCPDWTRLVARREESGGDSAAWRSALAHRRECASCREQSLRAAPELIFRGALEVAVDDRLVQEMRQRVEGARRHVEAGRRAGRRRAGASPLGGWLAAAALFAVVAAGGLAVGLGDEPAGAGASEASPAAVASADGAGVPDVDLALREHLTRMPVVEATHQIRAQFAAQEFDLVWVVADRNEPAAAGTGALVADL